MMDEHLVKVLEDSGCLQHSKYFTGITLRELRSLPLIRLKTKLTKLLSSAPDDRSLLVSKIITGISNGSVTHDEDDVEDLASKRTCQRVGDEVDIKPNIMEKDTKVVVDEDDDEITIVGEVVGEVAFVGTHVKTEQEIPQLTIDDEEKNGEADGDASTTVEPNSDKEIPPPERESLVDNQTNGNRASKTFFIPSPANILNFANTRRNRILFSFRPKVTTVPPPTSNGLNDVQSTSSQTYCPPTSSALNGVQPTSSPSYSPTAWDSLYDACGEDSIEVLECFGWRWNSLDMDSQGNLFRLLSRHSYNLRELTFHYNCSHSSTFSEPLNLPNLKVLKIRQEIPVGMECTNYEILNFSSQLQDIILATNGGLQEVELFYRNETTVNIFLDLLQRFNSTQLKELKSLFIMNEDESESIALGHQECEKLSKLSCHGLETLLLEVNLWDNVKIPVEAMLHTFPKMKKLVVKGCFLKRIPEEPKITLNFPSLMQLEYLQLGKTSVSISHFESITARPPKKKGQCVIRTGQNPNHSTSQEAPSGAENNGRATEYFPVRLNLPTLPKLKELTLGRLYELQELHFGRFPSLTSFKVSSSWQFSFKFPSETSRSRTYPKIRKLQLPDGLRDDSFVGRLMPHFPNVEECWINLPSVKVLRAFAFIMKDSSTLSFLQVGIQFDFASSLDACILAKPSEIAPSEEEINNIRTLKEYVHWEEYANFHQIEVPVYFNEATRLLEDEDKFAGLCVLKNKFKRLGSFSIRHIPRKLRLPRGDAHWNEDTCEFTDILIGFQNFPYSMAAWTNGPKHVRGSRVCFPGPTCAVKVPEESCIRMDSFIQSSFRKKESKD